MLSQLLSRGCQELGGLHSWAQERSWIAFLELEGSRCCWHRGTACSVVDASQRSLIGQLRWGQKLQCDIMIHHHYLQLS